MMSKKSPQLRFEGFTDDWEERKVKDIFKITRGQVLAATETSEEKSDISPFPVYSSQTKNNGLMGYYKDYLFDTAITWTTDGANAGTVSYRSGRFYSTNVNGVLISDKGYTNKAISEILNLEAWKWVSHVGNPKLMNNVMGDISIMIPSSFEEQDRLSDFLNQLDDTIALHQRKLDLLKEQKKGYLQKMFPKNGARVPELRFAGFADDWEERKFKDILKTHSFRSYLAGVSENGEYEVIQQGDKPIVGYSDGEPFTDYKDVTLFGDHTVSLYKPKSPFFVATDGVKILSADNFEGNYLYTTLERYKPEPQGYKRHFTILKNQDVWFTENMEEQQKIGSFFKQLDDTIALHQHKLDLLKEQKKGFLQKMFPKNGAKVPELRFAGFDDDWEQRKLGDLAEIKDSARIPNIKWQKEGVPYLRSSDLSSEHIKDGLFLSLADYMKYDKITGSPKKGDLIFASGGDIGLAIYKHDSLPIYVQGGSILYVKTSKCENLDGLFLKYSFASPKVKKYIRNASTGTSLKHFVLKPANALPISYPDLIEQEKIGSLLMLKRQVKHLLLNKQENQQLSF